MARNTLELDGDVLDRLAASLIETRRALKSPAVGGEAGTEQFGHDALAERVRQFSNTWDAARRDLAEAVGDLAGSARSIATTFETVDGDLAGSLDDGGAP